jgi:thiamine kinase-like enzyme
MCNRQQHWQQICAYLQKHVSPCEWEFTLPEGNGNETYFAHCGGSTYFVKIGASAPKYELLASEGLTPEVVSTGHLEDDAPILVQSYIAGKKPSRQDYQTHLDKVAGIIRAIHQNSRLPRILPPVSFDNYREAASQALIHVRDRWELYKPQVPNETVFVEDSLNRLAQIIPQLAGSGLVASHNDICNANWILTEDDRFYLVDLEAMSLGDPACDAGALLWWYFPPAMRQRFLEIAGYPIDRDFQLRMQVNMAIHSLRISLPRENSFDTFIPSSFGASLTDLKAVLAGEENPQGYE